MITDHSNRIAYLQVLIDLLTDWKPRGQWQEFPILKSWQANHYGLTMAQFDQLTAHLEYQHEQAARELVRQQTLNYGLVGGHKDAYS
jgi:hypothetical protein